MERTETVFPQPLLFSTVSKVNYFPQRLDVQDSRILEHGYMWKNGSSSVLVSTHNPELVLCFVFFFSMSGVNWHGMWEAGTRVIYKQRSFRSEMALWGDCRALELMVLSYSGNKLTAAFSYGLRQPILQCTGEAILVKQCVVLGQIPLMVGAQAMQLCCPAQSRTWLINHSLQLTRQAAVPVTPQMVVLCSAGGLNSGT